MVSVFQKSVRAEKSGVYRKAVTYLKPGTSASAIAAALDDIFVALDSSRPISGLHFIIKDMKTTSMKRFISSLTGLLLVLLVFSGCSDGSAGEEDFVTRRESSGNETPGEELDEALNDLGSALEQLGQTLNNETGVEPVDYRELRDVLPRRVRGMEEGSYNGERAGSLGFKVSKVEQEYESTDGDQSAAITIVDMGSLKDIASFGVNWLNLELDRENDRGFERTTQIDGHPAMEKCEQLSNYEKCEVHLFIAERFVVDLTTRGLSADEMRDILDDMDLRKLEKMRGEGMPK